MALSPEQLAMRKTGISGSELAAVCGLSPWSSPVNVWENKLGIHQPDFTGNVHVVRGTLFEMPILQWYAMLTGRTVKQQPTIRHPDYPLIMATPDGIASLEGEDDRCLEVKAPGPHTLKHWGDHVDEPDSIAPYYIPQVVAQMAVTGLKMCDVVLFTGIEPRIYHVPYDDELFQALRETAEKFWRDHVLTRVPPKPDATPMYAEFLARYAPQTNDKDILDLQANNDAAFWVRQLKLARAQAKECVDMEETAKNNIKKLMGGHAFAKLPGGFATWKNSKPRAMTNWAAVSKEASLQKSLIEKHTAPGKAPRPFKIKFDGE